MYKKIISITLCVLSFLTLASQTKDRQNILFLFVDDMAYDCIASHGNDQVITPNIDRLSAQSTQFTHAFNAGSWSGAVCLASRTQMMTGQKLWHAAAVSMGINNNTNKALKEQIKKPEIKLEQLYQAQLLWPQIMENAGYETYYSGKWHVGGEELAKRSWQHTKNIRGGMPSQLKSRYKRTFIEGEESSWSPTNTANGGYWKGGKHWSEVLKDDAIQFLNQTKKSDKPFLMTIAFNAPHDPKQAPQEFQDMYPYNMIDIPENFIPEYPYDFGANTCRDEKLAPFPRTPYSIKVNRSEYYALITHLDVQIGKVLDHLEKTDQAKNTIIMFTADHGLAQGQNGMMGKQNMYDHSVRVPWLISGPGIPKGKKIKTPIYLQDVMATSMDIAGIEKPKHIEFNSVLPIINNENKDTNNVIYGAFLNKQRMVRTKDYKYILYPFINVERLYDLNKDPLEMNDISKTIKCKKTLKKMRALLTQEMEKMNDPLDLQDLVESYKLYKHKKKTKH